MKKGFEKIVAWQYEGVTAIGVLQDSDNFVSVALNYMADSQMKEGDLWYADTIYTDEGTSVRSATDEEIKKLLKALDAHHVAYEYDQETKRILDYKAYYYSNHNQLSLREYQQKAMTTCMKSSNNPLYMLFMLGEEVGELQGKFSKAIRKGQIFFDRNHLWSNFDNRKDYKEWKTLVKKEIGDILWGCAGLCHVMKWELEEIGQINLDKLAARKESGTIVGEGDNR